MCFFCKPAHQLLCNEDIYKNKDCAECHKGAGNQRRIFNAQKTLADNQGVYRKSNQACDAGRNVAAINAYLNQMNKKVKVAAKEGSQPEIPEKIAVYKICEC